MNKRIDVQILTRDRPTELAILLWSLREQTYKEFDVMIYDDCSGTPLQVYHFLNCVINRLKFDGHRVEVIRGAVKKGIWRARQLLAEHSVENSQNSFICRLDDDVILERDYLEKLMLVIDEGYDIASGITTPALTAVQPRSAEYVYPVINRVVLDKDGQFLINCDDCGYTYTEEVILANDHFRSCALYKKEIHEKVSYEDNMPLCGFREEEFFSFRAILAGYTAGCHTGAINWHMQTPSGGDRSGDYGKNALFNQLALNRFTASMYKKHGDFIEDYHKRLKEKGLILVDSDEDKYKSLSKNTNLIFAKGE